MFIDAHADKRRVRGRIDGTRKKVQIRLDTRLGYFQVKRKGTVNIGIVSIGIKLGCCLGGRGFKGLAQ